MNTQKQTDEALRYYDQQLHIAITKTILLSERHRALMREEPKRWSEIKEIEGKLRELVVDREMYLLLSQQLLFTPNEMENKGETNERARN